MLMVLNLTHYACVFPFPRFSWSISVLGLCAVGAIIGGLALAGIVPGAASTAGITVDPTAPVDPNEYQSCMQHIIYHVQLGFGVHVHEVYFLGRVFHQRVLLFSRGLCPWCCKSESVDFDLLGERGTCLHGKRSCWRMQQLRRFLLSGYGCCASAT